MANLCLKNISKSFGSGKNKKNVLEDISFEVEDKSFLVLLGESGCGKSTLLRLIAGLEAPDFGSIYINNKNMEKIPPKDRDIAFVFQSYALYPHLNVYDNMAFPLKIKGLDKKTIKEKILEASNILGLEELLKRKPKELSGGQKQRVALGRAIVRNPKVFLMDEPLSNLDTKLRANMRLELKKLHQKINTTFIYVTHDQTEALTMADKIIVLKDGKISQEGSPNSILNNPKNTFIASFSGNYPMNLFMADVIDGKFCFHNLNFTVPFDIREKLIGKNKVILGIRPENIKITPDKDSVKIGFDVEFVENTGVIKVVHLKRGDFGLKAVVSGDITKKMDFYFNVSDFFVFDCLTKEKI